MADYITDPELLKQLNGEPATPAKEAASTEYITDPALLAQLNPPASTSGLQLTEQTGPSAVPVLPIAPGPMITAKEIQAAKNIGAPIIDASKAALGAYKAAPYKIAADLVTTSATGIPVFGAAGAAENIMDKIKAAQTAAGEASKFISQTTPIVDPTTGRITQYPGVDAYREMWKSLPADDAARLSAVYDKGGGPNGVKAFIKSAEGKALMEANPVFREAAAKYISEVPGLLTQAGRAVAPVARTAMRALGPAGLAYDVYQAGEVARETELGPRLAAGQGQLAPAAAQAMMTQRNVSGYQPTPQEAANLLASGDQRTIEMYGGAQRLAQAAAARAAEPVQESWIDRAMSISRKYRPQ